VWRYPVSIWIRARRVKALHATGFTEHVLGYVVIEAICRQVVLALDQFESRCRHDEVSVLLFRANTAT
jgi:hypothetical protein